MYHPAAFSLETYLSVLLNVAVGFSKKQLTEYQDTANLAETRKLTGFIDCSFCILEENTQEEQTKSELSRGPHSNSVKLWQIHQMKLQAVCQCFRQCHQSNLVSQHIGLQLKTYLHDFKVLPVSAAHSFLCLVQCIVELTSPSESPGALGSRLPANLLLNLVPLTLVCLQHCASTTSSSVALEVNNVDSTSDIALLVNKHLFEAVVGLLVAVPEIVKDMLSLMQKIMSENSESVKQNCAAILAKLLASDARQVLLQSVDIVQLLVARIMSPKDSGSCNKQWFADLQYQYSLFKVEAGVT